MYRQPEKATIVAVEKSQPLKSVRQMFVTVKVEKDKKEISFWWTMSPTVMTESGVYSSKAPQYFGEFWRSEQLVGKEVNLYHAGDESHAYMTFTAN